MLSMNYASKLNYCLIHSLSSFHLNLKVENQWIITCINNASNLKKKIKERVWDSASSSYSLTETIWILPNYLREFIPGKTNPGTMNSVCLPGLSYLNPTVEKRKVII